MNSVGTPARSGKRVAPAAVFGVAAAILRCTTTEPPQGPIDVERLPVFQVEQAVRIGSVEDPDIGFSRIGGIAVDSRSSAYVLESRDRNVRVYDQNGSLLRMFGREGAGPGEFRSAGQIGIIGDTIWVSDPQLGRITLFSRTGEVISTHTPPLARYNPAPGISVIQRVGRLLPGGYVTTTRVIGSSGELSRDTIWIPIVVVDTSGSRADTVEFVPLSPAPPHQVNVGGHSLMVPFPPSTAPLRIDVLGSGYYVVTRTVATHSDRGEFTVSRIGADRDTVDATSFRYKPIPITSSYVDSVVSASARRYAGRGDLDVEVAAAALRKAVAFPQFHPPISSGRLGEDGSLWLLLASEPREPAAWIVISPQGTPRGVVQLPRGAIVHWSSGDFCWVELHDEFDVPWLVRYRFELESG